MNAEHTRAILGDFPELFKPPSFDLQSGLMAFGFECGDGWFGIVHGLCRDLATVYLELDPESRESFYVTQVKEKHGTLNFNTTPVPFRPGETAVLRPAGQWTEPWTGGDMEALIDAAEHASASTCEECGEAAMLLRRGYWLKTLCSRHAAELGYGPLREDS